MSLQIEGLSVRIGGRALLRNLSFKAQEGEFLSVAGPNGAGKTTLLRSIAGLMPCEGRILWRERDLAGLDALQRARELAYLPQGHTIHWPITAREAVKIGRAPHSSSLTRLSRADSDAIEQALEAVDAQAFAERPVTELSGGERARVMLARALAVGAPMLLADEPVAALDPAHQLSVMGLLSEQAKRGRLILCVSHDLALASRFADRFLVLNDGEIAAIGAHEDTLTPDIYERVFGVSARRFESDGGSVTLPWEPMAR